MSVRLDRRPDIAGRADIVALVDTFYARVRADARLGPIFDEVAAIDWATHLPRMYDFWETVLFGGSAYHGNPLAAHLALAARTPLGAAEFAQWLRLFDQSVDELFAGPLATDVKLRAARIADALRLRIGIAVPPPGRHAS